jgi:hypothetical protein
MGSTAVRLPFRKLRGITAVLCLLGVLDMRVGVGEAGPLQEIQPIVSLPSRSTSAM